MIEAMACGTPVLALAGGSVTEVVGDAGVVCQSVEEMVDAVRALDARCALPPTGRDAVFRRADGQGIREGLRVGGSDNPDCCRSGLRQRAL